MSKGVRVGMEVDVRKKNLKEALENGKEVPQFLYVNGELMMPLPNDTFLYFPRFGGHIYLNREQAYKVLLEKETTIEGEYRWGNVLIPPKKKS